MWDDARALRRLSNVLLSISCVLILIAVGHYVIHLPTFPVRTVELSVTPQRVDVAQIEQAAQAAVQGNFFTVDLDRVRRTLEQVPWVRHVSVRREFPWKLDVELEEQVALARWNDAELVNVYGEVFTGETDAILPQFTGGAGSSPEVTQMYRLFSEKLQPLNQSIAQISLSPRRAWQLRLENGVVLELGKDQVPQRLARFVEVYPYSLATLPAMPRYVDLRYRNGFAAYLPGGNV